MEGSGLLIRQPHRSEARYQIYVQGVGGFFPIPRTLDASIRETPLDIHRTHFTFDVIEPTPPPDLRPHLSCDNGDTDSAIDKNGTSCDSIDGADVMVTLTVTRPNGTTVSSLTYYVEWDVRGGVTRSIGSSHPTSTTSRGRHLLTWASTGLTTGDQGVVVAGVRPNGYDHAFNSNQVTIVMKERDLPPVLNAIACTPRVTPQGDNPAVCTATLDAPGGQGHLVDLSIDASDPNDDPLTYIWRADRGSFNSGVRTNRTTWSAAGLSTGQYTVTANVAERLTGVHTQDVVVDVVRYTPSVQIPVYTPYACTPDAGWENGSPSPKTGDPYCGQLHDRSYTWTGFTDAEDYLYNDAVGSAGSPEVTLAEGIERPGIGLYQLDQNRICGVARGVCGEANSYYDSSIHNEGGNIYQWVNVYPSITSIVKLSAAGSIVLPAAIHAPTASRVWSRPKPRQRLNRATRYASNVHQYPPPKEPRKNDDETIHALGDADPAARNTGRSPGRRSAPNNSRGGLRHLQRHVHHRENLGIPVRQRLLRGRFRPGPRPNRHLRRAELVQPRRREREHETAGRKLPPPRTGSHGTPGTMTNEGTSQMTGGFAVRFGRRADGIFSADYSRRRCS